MYTTFFKMAHSIFLEHIPAKDIIKDERMSQGLARLSYFINDGSIALITGKTGVGKSTLIKLFLDGLSNNHYHPIYIHFTNIKSSSLLNLIAIELGGASSNSKDRRFLSITQSLKTVQGTPILIIDEAHLLPTEAIVDLRLLVSSAINKTGSSLKIILCGQDDLRHTIKSASCTDFANRVSVGYAIKPLSKTETAVYITKQLKSADADVDLFDAEVVDEIFNFTSGVPRSINRICTTCLIHAAGLRSQKITTEILTQAVSELTTLF